MPESVFFFRSYCLVVGKCLVKKKKKLTKPKMLHCHAKVLFETLFIFLSCLSEVFWDIVDFNFLANA